MAILLVHLVNSVLNPLRLGSPATVTLETGTTPIPPLNFAEVSPLAAEAGTAKYASPRSPKQTAARSFSFARISFRGVIVTVDQWL